MEFSIIAYAVFVMSRTLTDVLVERERLLARCGRERDAVAGVFQSLTKPAAVFDGVAGVGRFLARYPVVAAGIAAALAVSRGRSIVKLAIRGAGLWRIALRARDFMRLFYR
jgi:hypothetical protein